MLSAVCMVRTFVEKTTRPQTALPPSHPLPSPRRPSLALVLLVPLLLFRRARTRACRLAVTKPHFFLARVEGGKAALVRSLAPLRALCSVSHTLTHTRVLCLFRSPPFFRFLPFPRVFSARFFFLSQILRRSSTFFLSPCSAAGLSRSLSQTTFSSSSRSEAPQRLQPTKCRTVSRDSRASKRKILTLDQP